MHALKLLFHNPKLFPSLLNDLLKHYWQEPWIKKFVNNKSRKLDGKTINEIVKEQLLSPEFPLLIPCSANKNFAQFIYEQGRTTIFDEIKALETKQPQENQQELSKKVAQAMRLIFFPSDDIQDLLLPHETESPQAEVTADTITILVDALIIHLEDIINEPKPNLSGLFHTVKVSGNQVHLLRYALDKLLSNENLILKLEKKLNEQPEQKDKLSPILAMPHPDKPVPAPQRYITSGESEKFKRLYNLGLKLEISFIKNNNLAHLAAATNRKDILKFIFNEAPHLFEKTNDNNLTPAMHEAKSGRFDSLYSLKEIGVDIFFVVQGKSIASQITTEEKLQGYSVRTSDKNELYLAAILENNPFLTKKVPIPFFYEEEALIVTLKKYQIADQKIAEYIEKHKVNNGVEIILLEIQGLLHQPEVDLGAGALHKFGIYKQEGPHDNTGERFPREYTNKDEKPFI